jgi:hypothetical protein
MKKFLLKLSIFLAVIGIPFGILNELYKNTNYWKSANEVYELRNHPDDITLLNLGNSHEMYGLRYEKYYQGVSNNFATSSQPFYYSYQVLKNAKSSICDGAVVLVPVSYFDWYYNWRELFANTKTYNNRYYSFLKPRQVYNYELDTHIECGIFPLLTAKENVKYIFHDTGLPDIEAENLTALMDRGADHADDVVDYKYNSWVNDVMNLGEGKDRVYEENRRDLVKLIEYCYDEGYHPVLLCTPVTSLLNQRFSEEFLQDFDEKTQEICRLFPELLFLDYSKNEEFTDSLQYYTDSDHMNSLGGDIYTKKVLHDLADAGVIGKELLKEESVR